MLWVLGSEFKSMTVQQALYYLSLLLAITHIFVIVRGVYVINKDIKIKPYIWTWGRMPETPMCQKPRQEDCNFKVSLGYIARSHDKNKTQQI